MKTDAQHPTETSRSRPPLPLSSWSDTGCHTRSSPLRSPARPQPRLGRWSKPRSQGREIASFRRANHSQHPSTSRQAKTGRRPAWHPRKRQRQQRHRKQGSRARGRPRFLLAPCPRSANHSTGLIMTPQHMRSCALAPTHSSTACLVRQRVEHAIQNRPIPMASSYL